GLEQRGFPLRIAPADHIHARLRTKREILEAAEALAFEFNEMHGWVRCSVYGVIPAPIVPGRVTPDQRQALLRRRGSTVLRWCWWTQRTCPRWSSSRPR